MNSRAQIEVKPVSSSFVTASSTANTTSSVASEATTTSTSSTTPTTTATTNSVLAVLPAGGIACTLCKRQFASMEVAEKHVQLSQLHAQNVQAAATAAAIDAEVQAKLNEDRQQRLAEDRKAIKDQKRDARAQMLEMERELEERARKKQEEALEKRQRRAKAIAEGDEATLATLGDADDAEADLGKKLSDDNVGSKLLKLMGWKEGQGLGADGSGITAPIRASGSVGNAGIGARGTSRLNATAVAGATYRQSLYAMASARYDATDPDQKAKAREVEEMFFSGKVGDGDDDDDDKTANKKRKTK